jgi:hypothetical protein
MTGEIPGMALEGACTLDMQDEHHPLLSRPPGFVPALSLSGAASLARVDSSFGMRALEQLNPEGAHWVPVHPTEHSASLDTLAN